jgi:hypothetical protein
MPDVPIRQQLFYVLKTTNISKNNIKMILLIGGANLKRYKKELRVL